MADGYLDQVLGWLKGAPPAAAPVLPSVAPPLASYPSNEDAQFARQSGFSQGSPNESFLNNSAARVYGHDIPIKRFDPTYIKNLKSNPNAKPTFSEDKLFLPDTGAGGYFDDLNWSVEDKNKNKVLNPQAPENHDIGGQTDNMMMRAALAANRSPVAAVGFDPSRVIIDTLIKNPTIGGLYNPKSDSMYTNLRPEDAVVHEATHRGLKKLREQFPDQVKNAFGMGLPDEESVVRWLMHTKAGDPEAVHSGPAGAKQRQYAIDYFNDPRHAEFAGKGIKQLEELAIENMKGRGKRAGPQ